MGAVECELETTTCVVGLAGSRLAVGAPSGRFLVEFGVAVGAVPAKLATAELLDERPLVEVVLAEVRKASGAG